MRRGGRKRRQGVKREGSGRAQRPTATEAKENMLQVVLEARTAVFGLTPDQARAMPETTVLARLYVTGELSEAQYEAGTWYRGVVREYDRYMLAKGLPAPGDLNRSHGHDNDDGTDGKYVDRFKAAIAMFSRCDRALMGCGDRMARASVNAIVLSDLDAPYFVGSLRIGLNALAHVRGERMAA